jgi:hypothetical protein
MARTRVYTTDPVRVSAFSLDFDAEIVGVAHLSGPPEGAVDIKGWPPDWLEGAPRLGQHVELLGREPPTSRVMLGLADASLLTTPEVTKAVEIAEGAGVGAVIFVKPTGD